MKYLPKDHSFIICAFRESPYLEQCILSLKNQLVPTAAAISTSTPNEHIRSLAEKYGLEVFVNAGEKGIAGDWNFALSCAKTPLVTLAHQDDIYLPEYTAEMLRGMNAVSAPLLFSSNYGEKRGEEEVYSNRLLNVKKLLRLPMRLFPGKKWARRMSLAFGDSICCPSVTYVSALMKRFPFEAGLKAGLDWQEWEKLSRLEGSFAYSNKPLMLHRIHAESETSRVIENTGRSSEDLEMFRRFWPEPVAKALSRLYAGSEKSNEI